MKLNREYRLLHRQQKLASDALYRKKHSDRRVLSRETRRSLQYANTPVEELLTSAEWLAILAEANGYCAYCGRKDNLTLDHVIPLSRGGKHSKDNVVAACKHCNCSKGTKTLAEWSRHRDAGDPRESRALSSID